MCVCVSAGHQCTARAIEIPLQNLDSRMYEGRTRSWDPGPGFHIFPFMNYLGQDEKNSLGSARVHCAMITHCI